MTTPFYPDLPLIEDISHHTVGYIATMEEEKFMALLKRIETLLEWITNARALRERLANEVFIQESQTQ